MNSIAWKTAGTPLPMEINPRIVFERLFGVLPGISLSRKRTAIESGRFRRAAS
jgi:hypothetical protein